MRLFNPIEKLAHQQRHPNKPIKYFTVEVPSRGVVFENNSAALCKRYIKKNNLKPEHLKTVR